MQYTHWSCLRATSFLSPSGIQGGLDDSAQALISWGNLICMPECEPSSDTLQLEDPSIQGHPRGNRPGESLPGAYVHSYGGLG